MPERVLARPLIYELIASLSRLIQHRDEPHQTNPVANTRGMTQVGWSEKYPSHAKRLRAAWTQEQEPVGFVDENDEGRWGELSPNVNLRVGDKLYADPPALAERVSRWEITPNGTEGYRKAEVTAGGVSTEVLSSQTLESRQKGLYFIGEVVDVTGWLGGYNFQWAWASANACAIALAESLKSPKA